MRTVGPRLAAGLIAAGLVLSGCGGSPEPKPLPKQTEPSPSASASPSPPVMPAAAKKKSKAGAEAFVRHLLDLVNYADSDRGYRSCCVAVEHTAGCASCKRVATPYRSGSYRERRVHRRRWSSSITAERSRNFRTTAVAPARWASTLGDSDRSARSQTGPRPLQGRPTPVNSSGWEGVGWKVGASGPAAHDVAAFSWPSTVIASMEAKPRGWLSAERSAVGNIVLCQAGWPAATQVNRRGRQLTSSSVPRICHGAVAMNTAAPAVPA